MMQAGLRGPSGFRFIVMELQFFDNSSWKNVQLSYPPYKDVSTRLRAASFYFKQLARCFLLDLDQKHYAADLEPGRQSHSRCRFLSPY